MLSVFLHLAYQVHFFLMYKVKSPCNIESLFADRAMIQMMLQFSFGNLFALFQSDLYTFVTRLFEQERNEFLGVTIC